MMPAEAVTAPRFSTDHMENSFDLIPTAPAPSAPRKPAGLTTVLPRTCARS